MSTFIRLSKFLRQHSVLSKTLLNKLNIENDSRKFLNYYQTVYFINQFNNYSTIPNTQININDESDIDQKMVTLNKEAIDCGMLIKFNIDDLLHNMRKSGTISNLKGLFLLRCCSELIFNKSPQLRQKLAEEIWNMLKESGVHLEVSHYNALLAVYVKTDYQFSPFDILWEMLNAQVEPNQVTFQKLISYFCNNGKIKEASQILKYMEDKKLPITENILSNFIFAHCMNNNMNDAMEIIKNMQLLNITVTSQTYSALMYAFARKGNIESIKKVLAECKNNEIIISEKVFLNIIYELCVNGFSEKVDEILPLLPRDVISVKEGLTLIYRLIEKEQDDTAFKILEYLPTSIIGENEIISNFFIESLIIFNTPVEKIIAYCQSLKEKGIFHLAFVSAINKSIENHKYESSFSFIKAWKELGGLIKEDYFYPIIKAYRTTRYKDVNTIVQKMILEFEVNPSIYMLKTYILPYMQDDVEEVFSTLINHQVNREIAANAIMLQLLSDNKIREAVKFMSKYHSFTYNFEILKFEILKAFKSTEDISSVVSILHYFYKNVLFNKIDVEKYQQFVDSLTLEVFNYLQGKSNYMILMFFSNLIKKGLSISPKVAEKIEQKLGEEITPEILSVLSNLKSGNLEPKPIFKQYGDYWPKMLMDIEKLENTSKRISQTNTKAKIQVKNDILIYYCSVKDEKKVCNLIEEFNKNNITMSIVAMNSLTEMFVDLQKIPQSEFWLNKMKENVPNFRIRQDLCLKLAIAYINNGNIKKALEYLVWPKYGQEHFSYQCIALVNAVLKYDDEKILHQFFEILSAHGYIKEFRNEFFAPFIQLHLNRNDGEAALEKFEWIYNNYKLTPLAIELMKKFISADNKQQLEKIKKICTTAHGKQNALFNVAMAYLENNRKEEAMSIIKNHCSKIYEDCVRYYAEKKYRKNQVQQLEKLFEIFNDLKYDVDILCVLLLKSYSALNDWNKCYDFWLKMQERNINPSSTFIDCLNFIIINKSMNKNESLKEFSTAMEKKDFNKAIDSLQRVPLIYKRDCYSILCQKYLRKNQFSKVVELWKNLNLDYNTDINLMTAELILSKMLEHKDLDNIEKIEEFITPRFKRQLGYNYYLNQAYLQSGCWNLYLEKLEYKLNEGKITSKNLNLHLKTVIDSLMKYPELCKNFECLAYKFAENNILEPVTALWIYYFLLNDPLAEEIWIKYFQNSALFLWLDAMNFPQCKVDPDLYVKLAKLLNQSSIERNIKLTSYRRLLKKCLQLNDPKKYEYGLQCLQLAMINFDMNQFDIPLLVELQKGLEASGIAWPWTVNQSGIQSISITSINGLRKGVDVV